MVQGFYELSHEVMKGLQARGEVLIPEGVYIGDDMILWRSLRRGSTTENMNRGLDTSVIEANNVWMKVDRGRGGERG